MIFRLMTAAGAAASLAACGAAPYDPRGVEAEETLLSVSAVGEAESRPDEAQFQAGVNSWSRSAQEASAANARDIREVVDALKTVGISEEDIQTRTVGIQRIDYGDRKGQYQASNVVSVTVRDIAKAGAAVTAVTEAGANLMSGPDLRMSDPEAATNTAYGNAFRAARARADAYAEAAGMRVARVLTIRDAGGAQGQRYIPGAPPPPVSPPPPYRTGVAVTEQAADASGNGIVMPGQTKSAVAVQVDFALAAK